MGLQDAQFNAQIFRKDNPIILACRRDQAVLMGIRIAYDGNDYQPGQVLAYNTSDTLYYRLSGTLPAGQGGGAVSGTYSASVVLFDQVPAWQMLGNNGGVTGGVSGSALVRGLISAKAVYTANLIDYSSGAKTSLASKDFVDAGGVQLTKF